MKSLLTRLCAASLAAVVLSACMGAKSDASRERPDPLLLISIDGFRHDYVSMFESPNIDRLIEGGLHADSLHQVFPTKTFATHYSIVTGLHPGTHGVVANNMWDPKRDAGFSLGDRDAVGDGYWYEGGEPIWVTAEKQGLTAATFFWPGSEARIRRVRPTHWKPYAGDVPHATRIDQVLEWTALPERDRPDFMTLYFSVVDSLGHGHGPAAEPVLAAAERLDRELGRLIDGLEAQGRLDEMHIILVSDHGMSEIDKSRYIMLNEYLDLGRVRVSDWGPAAQIWATDMPVGDIVDALDGAHPKMRVWARDDIPDRYRFGSHHRVPDVLVEADPGWMISNRAYMAQRQPPRGMHGWDPAHGEQHGLFIAHGPAFPAGSRSPAVRSVDLYALMSELLGLEAAENEGTLAPFAPYLGAGDPPAYRVARFDCAGERVEARIGPAHMALHVGDAIHVLDRVAEHRYREADLEFTIEDDHAAGVVDGRRLEDCRRLETDA
ncbi:MAG: ectonucleotide pyrophosphatase/phosphodiesterase [Wenzhouxiangella sp.]